MANDTKTIGDIADEVFRMLDEPDDISIPSVAFWLRTNLGNLNSLIMATFTVDPSTDEVFDNSGNEIASQQADILKQTYMLYYAQKQIRKHLGAAGIETVLQVDADGATIRRANRTTIAAEWRQFAKDEAKKLQDMVTAYRLSKGIPQQVVGTDTVPDWLYPVPNTTWPRGHF